MNAILLKNVAEKEITGSSSKRIPQFRFKIMKSQVMKILALLCFLTIQENYLQQVFVSASSAYNQNEGSGGGGGQYHHNHNHHQYNNPNNKYHGSGNNQNMRPGPPPNPAAAAAYNMHDDSNLDSSDDEMSGPHLPDNGYYYPGEAETNTCCK